MILSNGKTLESLKDCEMPLNNLKANKDIYDDAMHNTVTVPQSDLNLRRK